jgi:Family of unknown function (DUF5330)
MRRSENSRGDVYERDRIMFFLLRMAFWLTLVLAILPTGSSQPQAHANASQIDPTDAVIAAGAAVSDMTGFCDRQPEACKVGATAAVVIGQRAQAGASMVYDFIHERMARNETGSVGEAKVVPASMTRQVPAHPGSQSTLKPVDLEPSWQGSISQGSMPRKEHVPLPRPRAKQPV